MDDKIIKFLQAKQNCESEILYIACIHDQNKSGFFGGPAFPSQSELFDNLSDCSDWPDKSQPYKKATFVLIM